MKCLEHEAANRWPDVAHLARAIGPFGTGACTPLVDTIEHTLRQELRRYSGQAIVIKPTGATTGAHVVTPRAAAVDVASITQEAPAVVDLPPPQFVAKRSRWWVVLVALVALGATLGVLVNAHVLALPAALSPAPLESASEMDSASESASAAPSAVPSTSATHHHSLGAPSTHAHHVPR